MTLDEAPAVGSRLLWWHNGTSMPCAEVTVISIRAEESPPSVVDWVEVQDRQGRRYRLRPGEFSARAQPVKELAGGQS